MSDGPPPDQPVLVDPEPAEEPVADAPGGARGTASPHRHRDWRWAVGGVGRVLIAMGLLILAFVVYQLWGTGLQEAASQNDLEKAFAAQLATTTTAPPATTTPPATTAPGSRRRRPRPTSAAPPTTVPARPDTGVRRRRSAGPPRDPQDRPRQDRRGGRGRRRPQEGPGPLPRHAAARASSATPPSPATAPPTARPFGRINELDPGDEIIVTTYAGRLRLPGHRHRDRQPVRLRRRGQHARRHHHAHVVPSRSTRPASASS